jgi:hypothetical protein
MPGDEADLGRLEEKLVALKLKAGVEKKNTEQSPAGQSNGSSYLVISLAIALIATTVGAMNPAILLTIQNLAKEQPQSIVPSVSPRYDELAEENLDGLKTALKEAGDVNAKMSISLATVVALYRFRSKSNRSPQM